MRLPNFRRTARRLAGCAPLLLAAGCALTKPYPAFTDTRSEREGEALQVDPYRPPAIGRQGPLQGVEVVLEVDSPGVWTRTARRPRIVSERTMDQPIGRVYVLGRVTAGGGEPLQPIYLFPVSQLAAIAEQDPGWEMDTQLLGGPGFVSLGQYLDEYPDARLDPLPVIGVDSVWRNGKAQPIPSAQRLDEDFGLRRLLGSGRVVPAEWLARTDSVKAFGSWMKFPEPGRWAVRVRPARTPAVDVQPGELADYPFLAAGDWSAADSAEREFLGRLRATGRSRARVLLVCAPREAPPVSPKTLASPAPSTPVQPRNACLRAGETYLLQFGPSYARISQPFRVERRGGFFSLVVGIAGSLVLLAVSAG